MKQIFKTIGIALLITFAALLLSFKIGYSQDKESNTTKVIDKTSNAIETVYSDVKGSIPHINKAIESLGEDLKIGAHAVWDVLVRQQVVWSLAFLALTLSAIFNWYIYYSRNFKAIKKDKLEKTKSKIPILLDNPEFNQEYHDRYKTSSYSRSEHIDIRYRKHIIGYKESEEYIKPIENGSQNKILLSYVHLISCILLSVASIWNFKDMLTGFINPEFGALKTIATIAEQLK